VIKVVAIGSVAGLVLGVLASRLLAAIVYQAGPRDPIVLAGAAFATLCATHGGFAVKGCFVL
jgi:hypothetical protein